MRTQATNTDTTTKLLLILVLALPLNGCMATALGVAACGLGCDDDLVEGAVGAGAMLDKKMFDAYVEAVRPKTVLLQLTVAGSVTHKGVPQPFVRVGLYSRGELLRTRRTLLDGTYEVSAMIESHTCHSNVSLTVVFTHPEGRQSDPVEVDCGEQQVDFDF